MLFKDEAERQAAYKRSCGALSDADIERLMLELPPGLPASLENIMKARRLRNERRNRR